MGRAELQLSPPAVTLLRGESTNVSVSFYDYQQREGAYTVSAQGGGGVTVTPLGPSTITGSAGTVILRLSASPQAELGQRQMKVNLSGPSGLLSRDLALTVR